jgi:hypothetical protein
MIEKATSGDVQWLRELVEQLGLLIECADKLPPGPKRDTAINDLVHCRECLNIIAERLLH